MKFNGPGKSASVLYHTSKSKANIFKSPSEFFCVRPEIYPEINNATRPMCAHTAALRSGVVTGYGISFSRPGEINGFLQQVKRSWRVSGRAGGKCDAAVCKCGP